MPTNAFKDLDARWTARRSEARVAFRTGRVCETGPRGRTTALSAGEAVVVCTITHAEKPVRVHAAAPLEELAYRMASHAWVAALSLYEGRIRSGDAPERAARYAYSNDDEPVEALLPGAHDNRLLGSVLWTEP